MVFEKWIWVELAAFDPDAADCGAPAYLDGLGFVPEAINLLISYSDFVHTYDGKLDETAMDVKYGALGGRSGAQSWKRRKLAELIRQMHKRDVAVFLAIMPFVGVCRDGKSESPWYDDHPELIVCDRTGSTTMTDEGRFSGLTEVNVLARLDSGELYQEVFVRDLVRVLVDFDFDGFHGADGMKCFSKTLDWVEYSDGMVAQFQEKTGIEVPGASIGERSQWIWTNHRIDWIRFYAQRWREYWIYLVNQCRKAAKRVIINSPWGRDPLDALQRYGVDYRLLEDIGIEAIVFEDVSSVLAMMGPLAYPRTPDRGGYSVSRKDACAEFAASMLLIGAYAPTLKILPFTTTHDRHERWDTLRHEPNLVEKGIFTNSQLHLANAEGKPRRIAQGTMVCLGDGLEPHDWNWLNDRWEASVSFDLNKISGPVVVWSDRAMQNEMAWAEQRWTTHRLLYSLTAGGLPVMAAGRLEHISRLECSLLLVFNPDAYPAEELELITKRAEKASIPVAMIGTWMEPGLDDLDASVVVEDVQTALKMKLLSFGLGGRVVATSGFDLHAEPFEAEDATVEELSLSQSSRGCKQMAAKIHRSRSIAPYHSLEPHHFLSRLPEAKVPRSFMYLASEILKPLAWPDVLSAGQVVSGDREESPGSDFGLVSLETDRGKVVLSMNHSRRYKWLRISFEQPAKNARSLGKGAAPSFACGDVLDIMVPSSGAVMSLVNEQEKQKENIVE